ncbi:MAG: ketopantoate reductase family protein [Spirochaetia bacterium]|jgi:2-dehydropantoate 2-reductase|nr:ketopantoate reductase family protein [Spirochaetia bacterium]
MNLYRSEAANHICIAGLGGVGGYFGGMIALNITSNYKDKRDVTFIARGPHLEAVKKNGLVIKPWTGEPFTCYPNVATDRVSDLPYLNLIIAAVKGYDLEDMMKSLKEKITDETVIIPLLNGVDNEEKIRKVTVKGIILPSCVYIASKIEEPGVISMMGDMARIVSGPDLGNPDYDKEEIIAFFKSMGINFKWDENPQIPIWKKFIFIAPAALITAANNVTINGIAGDPALKSDFYGIMEEIRAIAEKKDIILPADSEEKSYKIVENIDKNAKTSFQLDLEKGKSKTEIDTFGYSIVRMGKETGISTPVTEKVLKTIKI